MYQTIHEEIKVAGVFWQGRFEPRRFQWRQRVYRVERVTLRVSIKDGGVRWQRWAVVSGANVYRLLYNFESQVWWLEEIWLED